MYYDLCIKESACANPEDLADTLTKLHYGQVAVDHFVSGKPPVDFKPSNSYMRFKNHVLATQEENDPEAKRGKYAETELGRNKALQVLSRLTVELNQPSDINFVSSFSPIIDRFDILAVCPQSEKLLQQVLGMEVDILCFDFTKKLPFRIKRPHLNVALEKGIMFEIQYAHLLRSSAIRRTCLSSSFELLETVKGKNVILSSGAANVMEIRGPYDAMNLCSMFNVESSLAKNFVTANSREAVRHGQLRGKTFKSAVAFQPPRERQLNVSQGLEVDEDQEPEETDSGSEQSEASDSVSMEEGHEVL